MTPAAATRLLVVLKTTSYQTYVADGRDPRTAALLASNSRTGAESSSHSGQPVATHLLQG